MLAALRERIPSDYGTYIEPFFGGGALFFDLAPASAIISDSNEELINLYRVVRDTPSELIRALQPLKPSSDAFYKIRSARPVDALARAARILYLNKTCYNGLYRVNAKGEFNVPFGKNRNPTICNEDAIYSASTALAEAKILGGDYRKILEEHAKPGDFIFLDPPYLPVTKYADFKRYTKEQFYEEDHHLLAAEVRRLRELGCFVLLTNANHPLVHSLYSGFKIECFRTRRFISSNAEQRVGEDVIVTIPPAERVKVFIPAKEQNRLPPQNSRFPSSRYMGSKTALLPELRRVLSNLTFDSFADVFSGSGVVSYMVKAEGKQVLSNDFMHWSSTVCRALIENNSVRLNDSEISALLGARKRKGFVSTNFKDLFFSDEENMFIDGVLAVVDGFSDEYKKALVLSSLCRACLKKRPRGVFTYTGVRYDDGRKDLKMTLRDQFGDCLSAFNKAVFDNGRNNSARVGDALTFAASADLVYLDPPYYSPLSDNDYVRRYHFLEGICRGWRGVELQQHTLTKKFKSYPSPFSSLRGSTEAFDLLFKRFRDSIILLSYSSNSLPSKDVLTSLLAKHKSNVEVIALDHVYSFGNQNSVEDGNKNRVKEYLFLGY